MTALVLDSSVTIASFFADEQTEAVRVAMRRAAAEGALVPSLWRFEVANGLLMAERRRRLSADQREACLADLSVLPIETDAACDERVWGATGAIAGRYGLTVYDAAYLELALRLALPLATLDDRLRAAATDADIVLLGR